MAKALLMSGGVGGVSSDDVTAKREHVLQGYTALTSDSNDEPVQGTMANRGNVVDTVGFENAYWDSKFIARMEQGFYSQNGQYKPCVAIPYAVLAQTIGVDRSKMLDTLTIAGKQGQIKSINTQDNNYRANKSAAFGIDWWSDGNNPVFWIDFPHGNGYYHRSDNHPHTCIDAINLGDVTADKVMRGFTATSKNGVKFAGTMPDLQSGRTVFNGATFDNELVSGVATKSFHFNRELYSYQIANGYGYSGIYGGGMNLSLRTTSPELRGRKIGCILSQSNNLTPFRRIVVNYRTTGSISGNPVINFYAFIAPSRALVREGVEFNGARVDGFSQISTQIMASTRQGQLVIDTSNINEQAFLGFYASANASGAENFNGAIQITRIEFIN